MKRRGFLWLLGGTAATAAALWWVLRPASEGRSSVSEGRRPIPPGTPESLSDREGSGSDPLISGPDALVLLAVADVIVPRLGESPAASEIDLLPRFEALLAKSPARRTFYTDLSPDFAESVRTRVPMRGGKPDPELLARLCEHWHRALAREGNPESAARFFDALRSDVLRIYYASPAGWHFTGFAGPVHWSAEQLAGHG